jgi:monofunctional glycosyltransferase
MKFLRKGLAATLGLALLALLLYQLWFLAHILWWINHNPGSTAFMEARLESLREKNPEAKLVHRWVPYSRVSKNLKRALVAAEDARFLSHEGFDWEGIEYAMEKNLKKGKIVAGGSTISQQLSKNLFLSGERSVLRKGQEAIITVMIESLMSKRRILEIYLNVVEWGDAEFGAEAAARRYFGISASGLNAWQAARLAAMLPKPRWYETHPGSRPLAKRTRIILRRMPYARAPR